MISVSDVRGLYNGGLNVLPIRKDKRPACRGWKEIQNERQSEDCFNQYFAKSVFGVAVPTGFDSREIIDIDTKHDLTGKLVSNYKRLVDEHAPGLWERLTIVKTTSGGLHLVYRCKKIEGNLKLAMRARTPEELKQNSNAKPLVVIETRGAGGYAAAPPTPGYKLVSGNYIKPEWITEEERDILLNCARFLDEAEEEIRRPKQPKPAKNWTGATPWDNFNQKHTCLEILSRNGWSEVKNRGNKTDVKRPYSASEKDPAPVSGHIKNDEDVFFCWSTSTPFKQKTPYTPVQVYYLLEHGGDAKAGAKALYALGYGDRQNKRPENRPQENGVGNGTVDAKENPIEYAKEVAFLRRKQIGMNGYSGNKKDAAESARKYLKDLHGIEGPNIDAAIDEVMKMTDQEVYKMGYGKKITTGIYEKGRRYAKIKTNEDGTTITTPITNFMMNGLYLIKGSKPARIINFKAIHGESDTIAVPVENLTSDGTAKLVKGLGNFMTTWSKNQFEFILHHACRDQKKAETTEYLGHYEDGKIWVFGNGVLHYADNQFYPVNEHGISETPAGAYHIPQYKNEGEPMIFKSGEITFRQYYELMRDAFGLNGEVGAASVLAYAFSDILFNETGNIFLLFLAGKRETGKTSYADCVRSPFYSKKPATVNMKSNSTVKSRYRMLAKYSNGVVVFDEFTDVPKNTNTLVTAYNRDGYSRAATSNDNETLETPVRANSLFIGNYLPESEPAAMSRLIILPFQKYSEAKKQKSLAAYRKLTGQLRKGTGGMLREILTNRAKMEKEYSKQFAGLMTTDGLTKLVKDIRDAEKVAAIMATMQICGSELGLTIEEMERIEGYLMLQLKDQKTMVEATDHTSQFFTEVAMLIRDSTISEEKHFAFSEDKTEVVFRFSDCYRKAQESAIKQRRELVGKAMLKRLLMEQDAFIKGNESARYRIKRGGILDLGFVVEELPDDIKEALRGYPEEDPESKTESMEPKGGAAGKIPF